MGKHSKSYKDDLSCQDAECIHFKTRQGCTIGRTDKTCELSVGKVPSMLTIFSEMSDNAEAKVRITKISFSHVDDIRDKMVFINQK
jgi:hypothetical protein